MRKEDIAEIVAAIEPLFKGLFDDLRAEMDAGFGELRRDMNTMGREIREDMEAGFALVAGKFVEVDERFDLIDKRFEGVDDRFDRLEKRFDQNDAAHATFATKADFETMHQRIATLNNGQHLLLTRVGTLERHVFHAA